MVRGQFTNKFNGSRISWVFVVFFSFEGVSSAPLPHSGLSC